MKNLCLLIIISLTLSSFGFSQKKFSGTITYKIHYLEDSLGNFNDNMFPSTMTVSFRNELSRTTLESSVGKQTIIGNASEKSTIILMDVGDSKYAVKNSKEERQEAIKELPDVYLKYTDETKNIAGYNCKKVQIIQGDKTLDAYFTDEIEVENPNWQSEFKDIKGVLLEYTQISDDVKTKYIAVEIKKEKIKKKDFEIPVDYRIITKKELADALKETNENK